MWWTFVRKHLVASAVLLTVFVVLCAVWRHTTSAVPSAVQYFSVVDGSSQHWNDGEGPSEDHPARDASHLPHKGPSTSKLPPKALGPWHEVLDRFLCRMVDCCRHHKFTPQLASVNTTGLFGDVYHSGNDVSSVIVPSLSASLLDGSDISTDSPAAIQFNKELFSEQHDNSVPEQQTKPYAFPLSVSSLPFRTAVVRHSLHHKSRQCYYRVSNACVIRGELTFVVVTEGNLSSSPPRDAQPPPPPAVLRLCNELKSKVKMRVRVIHRTGTADEMPPPAPMSPRPLHVTACWQYYGFHLFQCIASAWITQMQHNMSNVDVGFYNHAISLPEASRTHFSHQMFMGSDVSFLEPKRGDGVYPANAFWGWWAQNTEHPKQLFEVTRGPYDKGPSVCYRNVLVGQPDHHTLTPTQRRVHAFHLCHTLQRLVVESGGGDKKVFGNDFRRKLSEKWLIDIAGEPVHCSNVFQTWGRSNNSGTRPPPPPACNGGQLKRPRTLRIVIAERASGKMQGSRRILNLLQILESVSRCVFKTGGTTTTAAEQHDQITSLMHKGMGCIEGMPSPHVIDAAFHGFVTRVVVCLVDWASIPLVEQFALVSRTHMLISAHGGGNTWLAMQPPRSVLIELWQAAYVPRLVFQSMAQQYNMRYYAYLDPKEREPGNFMHRNVVVADLGRFEVMLGDGVRYLAASGSLRVDCC